MVRLLSYACGCEMITLCFNKLLLNCELLYRGIEPTVVPPSNRRDPETTFGKYTLSLPLSSFRLSFLNVKDDGTAIHTMRLFWRNAEESPGNARGVIPNVQDHVENEDMFAEVWRD